MNNHTRLAISASLHCLTGCSIGEILGMVIGTGLGWHDAATVSLSVALAFVFGYSLMLIPMVRSGMGFGPALKLTVMADTMSITVMEFVDNLIMLLIPGAMASGPTTVLFWSSLAVALFIAFIAIVPVNRWLIVRGRGHALMHEHHH